MPQPVYTAIVLRDELPTGEEWYGPIRNVRPVVQPPQQQSPDAVRYGDFYAEGRAPTQQLARMPMWFGFNIAGRTSVMQDDFSYGKHVLYNTPSPNRGAQLALVERANIYRPEARAYGNQFVVDPALNPGPYASRLW